MKALAEKAEGLARRLSRGIWFSPSAVREQSQIGSWENWKIWSENKPFSSQSPFFFLAWALGDSLVVHMKGIREMELKRRHVFGAKWLWNKKALVELCSGSAEKAAIRWPAQLLAHGARPAGPCCVTERHTGAP